MAKTPADFQPGDIVEYTAAHGPKERGFVTSVNAKFVFVNYNMIRTGYGETSAATDPADLRILWGLSDGYHNGT